MDSDSHPNHGLTSLGLPARELLERGREADGRALLEPRTQLARVVQLHPLAPLQVPEQHSTPDEQGAVTSPTQIDLVPVHPHKTMLIRLLDMTELRA